MRLLLLAYMLTGCGVNVPRVNPNPPSGTFIVSLTEADCDKSLEGLIFDKTISISDGETERLSLKIGDYQFEYTIKCSGAADVESIDTIIIDRDKITERSY